MRKLIVFLLFACCATFGQQTNSDIIPATPGLNLGRSNQRWDGYFQNLDINGTCTVNGFPCLGSGGGNGITITNAAGLATVPGKQNGTIAVITDGLTANDCTVGGGITNVACQFNGTTWSQLPASSSANFASPPPLGNTTPNSVAGTVVNIAGSGLFFSAQPTCLFGESDNTLDEFEDVAGIPMWLPQGALGPCSQFLTYTPLPVGITPTDKQVPAWNAATGAFTIQSQTSTGGSNTQLQYNNSGALGGISNVATGSLLVSKGASSVPAFQTKNYLDIKDYGCIADDSTDNATCFTNAAAAVNAYTGSGKPTLFCGMGVGDIAYKSTTGLAFTVPMSLVGNCAIDYTGSGNEITLGPTGLVAFSAAQIPDYVVDGIYHSSGAGRSATAGISCSAYINCTVRNNHWYDWGSTTNYAFKANAPNPAVVLGENFWFSGTGGGQNFADIRASGGLGSDTALIHDNFITGHTGSLITSACSGTLIYIGGAHSKIVHNAIYGANALIRVSNNSTGYGISIEQNTLDTGTCALNGVNADIQLGDDSATGNIDGLIVSNNDLDGVNDSFVIAKAANATSVGLVRGYIAGNRSLVKSIPLMDSQVALDSSTQIFANVDTLSSATVQNTYFSALSTSAALGIDTCTRANGTLGANWTVVNGSFQILSNTCAANNAVLGNLAFYNVYTYPNDQYATITMGTAGAGVYIGPAVRVASAADTGYYALLEGSGALTIQIAKHVAGVITQLSTYSAGPVKVGDTFTLTAQGTLLVLYRNGTPILQATDSSIASGSPGLVGVGTTGVSSAASWAGGPLSSQTFNSTGITANSLNTTANCAAVGSAANPSIATCNTAPAGLVSCATAASGGTCTVNTTAVTANSEITINQRTDTAAGTRLSVTCNTTKDSNSTAPQITALTAGTGFTFQVGTIAVNPECFNYKIVN